LGSLDEEGNIESCELGGEGDQMWLGSASLVAEPCTDTGSLGVQRAIGRERIRDNGHI
jgi:hypothetical protein